MPLDILLVEDSPGDVRLAQEAFRDSDGLVHLHVVSDGVEAMDLLRHEGPYVDAPRPDLILLDLNLPKMDGREVLRNVKNDDSQKAIPTIVLTSSEADLDIKQCYQLQANLYLRKPEHWDAFDDIVKCIKVFWLGLAKLPEHVDDRGQGLSHLA
jgi:chemotaxis family two-component system response regulator Rcp1